MLLALAIGDAYGRAFEQAPEAFVVAHNNGTEYFCSKNQIKEEGIYTDDAQMSLAIAEVMLSGEIWTPVNLANSFVISFKRDRRNGYARRFYNFLDKVNNGHEFLQEINPFSDKAGACMRAAPIGLYPCIGDVIKKSRIQAAITHNTVDGINSSIAASLMVHYFAYCLGPKAKLGVFIQKYIEGDWTSPWHSRVGNNGIQCIRAATTALIESDSLSSLLKRSVAVTGDVDTVATIALAAGSCSREIKQDIPQKLIDTLENGTFGRDYIIDLDKQLWKIK